MQTPRDFLKTAVFAIAIVLVIQKPAIHAERQTAPVAPARSRETATRPAALTTFAMRPLGFEVNEGQAPPDVKFLAHGAGYNVYLTATDAFLAVRQASPLDHGSREPGRAADPFEMVRVQIVGANPRAKIVPRDKLRGRTAYYLGNDPAKWRTNVATYATIRYASVYRGVDLVYSGKQQDFLADWIVAPGASPDVIRVAFPGAQKVSIDEHGDLAIAIGAGTVRLRKPTMYQDIDGGRREVAGRYVMRANQQVGFDAPAYDRRRPLVIDPIFAVSTYLGGSLWDQGNGIALKEDQGFMLVAGFTYSTDFPSLCIRLDNVPCPPAKADGDAFLMLYDLNGDGALTAIFGGTRLDRANAVSVDAAGDTFVVGATASKDFPTTQGAFERNYRGDSGKPGADGDAFVMKFDPGFSLVYSAYLGGTDDEAATAVAGDAQGRAFVTGYTASNSFPTTNDAPMLGRHGAFQPSCLKCPMIQKAFLSVVSPDGSNLAYSSYFGGSGNDLGNGIAVDKTGMAYITGQAFSHDLPTTQNAFQPKFQCLLGYSNAFVAKFDPSQGGVGSLVWSTYLGGDYYDLGNAIAADSDGNSYVTGMSRSANFPVKNAMIPANPTPAIIVDHAFVTKINPAGTDLVFSTFIAGRGDESANAIALDSFNNIYIAGWTTDETFPTARPLRNCDGCTDRAGTGFVAEVNDTGSGLLYSTYLPVYQVTAIAVDRTSHAYLTGTVGGAGLPAVKALQGNFKSKWVGTPDAFVVKLTDGPTLPTTTLTFPYQAVGTTSAAQRVTLYAPAQSPLTIQSIASSDQQFLVNAPCGNLLVAGGICDIDVTFHPGSGGFKTATLTVTHGGAGSPATVALTGIGGFPQLSAQPVQLDFGLRAMGSTTTLPMTLTNNGDGPYTFLVNPISIEYAAAPACGQIIPAKTACTFQMSFRPGAGGVRPAKMTLYNVTDGSTFAYSLTGQGAGPAVGLSPGVLEFSAYYGLKNPQTITLTNTGFAPLNIASVIPQGDYTLVNSCPQTLMLNASCTINVTFKATPDPKLDLLRVGSVVITTNAQGSPHTVKLFGSLGQPNLGVFLPKVDKLLAKPVGTSSLIYANVEVLNMMTDAAALVSTATVDGDFTLKFDNCPLEGMPLGLIPPHAICSEFFVFSPKAVGPRTGTFTLTEISGAQHQLVITQFGTAPVAKLSTTTLNFAAQAVGTRSAGQAVTLTNTGAGDLNLSSVIAYGDFGVSHDCPLALAAGASCTITISSRPLSAGPRAGLVKITDDAPGSPTVVTLSGAGQ